MYKNIFIFTFFLLLTSCGSVPDIHYYVIDYPIESKHAEGSAKYDIFLGVESFTADPLYEEDRIVFRESPYEIKFYNYHQWITPPKEMATEKAIAQLRASGLFSHVVPFPQYSHVPFLLRGNIAQFEEWDKDNKWFAHVTIHLELLTRETNTLLWQNDFSEQTPVTEKKPIEVVSALGFSLEKCLNSAISDIDRVIEGYNNQ